MTPAIRTTAPRPLEPLPFNIGKPVITTLENGLKVVLFPENRLPLVSFRLAFLSGDAADPDDGVGITSAVASLLTEGTANYSSKELAEKIERLGASLSASSSEDFFLIAASSLSIYSTEILQLMGEILFRATFPEAELDLYKRNAIENLKFQRSQPGFLANEQVARILYGAHPYSRISPTAEDIEKFSREQLTSFYSSRLMPNNAVLIAVGDIDKEDFFGELDARFGGWKSGEVPSVSLPDPPDRDRRSLTIVDRPGSAQSNIVLANIAFPRNNPDYFAAVVMNQVLGAGASSRVFMNLREEKGYTYGAYTRLDARRLAGDFEATAEVRTQVTGDSLREFFYELERIRNDAVTAQELTDAKDFLTGVFPIRAETQEGLTGLIVNQQLHDLPEDYLQTYRQQIDAITIADVQRVANKYIHPDRLAIVIVGDAAEVFPQIRDYSDDISVFDTEGRPMENVDYEAGENTTPADIGGTWDLVLDFQGQQVPVSLTLEQSGNNVSGTIDTALGSGRIEGGSVKGSKLTATAATEIQGQSVELVVNGSVDGNTMRGTIATAMIPGSLPFAGTRKT